VGEKSSPNPNMQNPKPADIRPEPDPLPSLAQRLQPNAQTAALVSHSIRSRNVFRVHDNPAGKWQWQLCKGRMALPAPPTRIMPK
jgi:hypothetical protein